MTPTREEAAVEYLAITKRPTQGPCLVPRAGVGGVSCHENDFCECEVKSAHESGQRVGEQRMKEALDVLVCATKQLMRAYEHRARSACTSPEQIEAKPWRTHEYCYAEEALAKVEELLK